MSDDFIKGVSEIYNETPVRQGRAFKDYGKSPEALRAEFSRDMHRTDLVGAYFENELVGFLQQVYGGECAHPFGGLSKIAHRDKAVNNALLAKSVELCAQKNVKYIVYGSFDYGSGADSLADFKRYNGFQKIDLPRYYVPLTLKGQLGLKLRLHQGVKALVPPAIRELLIKIRKAWYAKKSPRSGQGDATHERNKGTMPVLRVVMPNKEAHHDDRQQGSRRQGPISEDRRP